MELRKFIATTIREYLNEQQEAESNLNDNFWKWFGNSKVNENGKPLVVYHGTNSGFNKFDKIKRGLNTDAGMLGKGFYFGSKLTASNYGNRIIPVYLKMENPLYINDFKTIEELASILNIDSDILTIGGTGIKSLQPYTGVFSDAIKEAGYDGVITKYEYVVFEPNQIKSIENDGTWDIGDDNIYS